MPSKTKKQAKAMRAACNDPKTRKAMKIDKATACEYAAADKRKGASRGKRRKA